MAVEKRETLNVPQRGEVWAHKEHEYYAVIVAYLQDTKGVVYAWMEEPPDYRTNVADLEEFCKEFILDDLQKGPLFKGRTAEEWWSILVKQGHEIEQILGKALGYPPLFPDASKVDDGTVCVGEHTCETVAMEAARKLKDLKMEMEQVEKLARSEGWSEEMNMLPWHLIEAVLLKERRDKQQYVDMLAKVMAPILVPLIDSLGAFLKTLNERGTELLKELEKQKTIPS